MQLCLNTACLTIYKWDIKLSDILLLNIRHKYIIITIYHHNIIAKFTSVTNMHGCAYDKLVKPSSILHFVSSTEQQNLFERDSRPRAENVLTCLKTWPTNSFTLFAGGGVSFSLSFPNKFGL
jgi:hypothetical protein